MELVKIPHSVDCLPQILFWEADEIAPAFLLAGAGIVTDTLTMLLIPIYFLTKYFVKFKQNHLDGFFHHLMYDWGVMGLNKRFTNSLIREWHE